MHDDRESDAPGGAAIAAPPLRAALSRFFARKGVEPAEIEDCVQDVFLRIVQRGACDHLEQFNGYVFTTAASVLTDRHRRRRARAADSHVPFEPEQHGDADFAADTVLADREALSAATRAILELPERTRQIFVLRRLEQLPYGEIALRLGISISAVEKHMVRAARHLIARGKVIR